MIAGFIGLLTFWMCEAANLHPLVTGSMVGIAGHMGSRAIFAMERVLEERMGLKASSDERAK